MAQVPRWIAIPEQEMRYLRHPSKVSFLSVPVAVHGPHVLAALD